MAISGVNFGATAVKAKQNSNRRGLEVKTVAGLTAIPVAVGLGYAGRFYYENKGKASVYEDMIKKFPTNDSFKDCLKIIEKNLKNAKIGAVALMVAGTATVLGYAGAKIMRVFDKKQPSAIPSKPESKTESKPEVKSQPKPSVAQNAPEAK